jgi:pimeloyl-ACP methyl ester carboxylesterase
MARSKNPIGMIILRLFQGVIITLAFLFIASWVMVFFLVYLFAHPDIPTYKLTPEDYGISYIPVQFHSTDGIPLNGWYVPAEGESRGLVILANGFRGRMDVTLGHIAFLHQAGYACVSFEYRTVGQGFFANLTFGKNESSDLLGVIETIREENYFGNGSYYILGLSMGAAAAVMSAEHLADAKGIILNSCFADFRQAMRKVVVGLGLPPAIFLPLGLASFYWQTGVDVEELSPAKYIGDMPVPVMIIQGQDDLMLGAEAGEMLFSSAPPGTEIWRVPEKGHLIVEPELMNITNEEYKEHILQFLSENN